MRLHRKSALIIAVTLLFPAIAMAQDNSSAFTRMNALGPENSRLTERVGEWDVVETVWATPDAKPFTSHWIAERKMIGPVLQEYIESRLSEDPKDIQRMDYLSFDRVEGRWKYVSMDSRAPVGLMPAFSVDKGDKGNIDLIFEPFAMPGTGKEVTGQLLSMTETITMPDVNHDQKDQTFMLADGTGIRWLAHRYAYTRRIPSTDPTQR